MNIDIDVSILVSIKKEEILALCKRHNYCDKEVLELDRARHKDYLLRLREALYNISIESNTCTFSLIREILNEREK